MSIENLAFLILSIMTSYLPVYYISSFKPPPSCRRKKALKIPVLLGLKVVQVIKLPSFPCWIVAVSALLLI